MRRAARVGSVALAVLTAACASSRPDPPGSSTRGAVPERPPDVTVEVESPPVSAAFPIPWTVPRPRLHLHVRPPAAAVRARSRRHATRLERARRRLEGAWSFVYGETIGMAIFERSGELVLQALGGDKVALRYRVLRAPGSEPGRIQLRPAPDSAAPGPGSARPFDRDRRARYRALFKWRSTGQLDLQIPTGGRDWPESFARDRYRLFRDVEEAVRYLERNEREWSGPAEVHLTD